MAKYYARARELYNVEGDMLDYGREKQIDNLLERGEVVEAAVLEMELPCVKHFEILIHNDVDTFDSRFVIRMKHNKGEDRHYAVRVRDPISAEQALGSMLNKLLNEYVIIRKSNG